MNHPFKQQVSKATLVTVYIRLPSSKSVKLQLPSSIPLIDLEKKIEQHLALPLENQLLFLGGKELHEGRPFRLTQLAIIHVKDRMQLLGDVTIQLTRHQPQQTNLFRFSSTSTFVKVKQGQRVRDFLAQLLENDTEKFDMKRSKIIECGRFLRGSKTFGEQKVQQNAQVHVILRQPLTTQTQNQQQQQHHDMFVKRVLQHSRNSSNQNNVLDGQNHQFPLPRQSNFLQQNGQTSEIILKKQHVENQGCLHHHRLNKTQLRLSLQSEALDKTNPQFSMRPVRSSLLNHTKSSEKWMRAKAKPSQLTPLKLGLKEYKKYDGPLSIRACNCKKDRQKSTHSLTSQEELPLSPLPSRLNKSQRMLHKSLSMVMV